MRGHCRAPNKRVLYPTGMPPRSAAPAIPPSGDGSPRTRAAVVDRGPTRETQTGTRRSGLEPVPTANSNRLTATANRLILAADERSLQVDLVRLDRNSIHHGSIGSVCTLNGCGTTRVFEEKPRKYVFRVNPHATMDNVAAAKYVLDKKKNISVYSAINHFTRLRIP